MRHKMPTRPEPGWIATYTGRQFFLAEPTTESIAITDVAHSLSNLCRFNGHCSKFYSVAEHSMNVAKLVSDMLPYNERVSVTGKKIIRTALLHDATEAYIGDMTRPLKRLPSMARYREMEQHIWQVMCLKWDLWKVLPDVVKEADETLLVVEGLQLFDPSIVKKWNLPNVDHIALQTELWEPMTTAGKHTIQVRCLDAWLAKRQFTSAYVAVGIS